MSSGFLSFKEQSAHYFNRPHVANLTEPLSVIAAWRGQDLRRQSDWVETLSPSEIDEIKAAMAAVKLVGKERRSLLAEDFPLPQLSSKIANWRSELGQGRGFHVIRGIPVAEWSKSEAELFFWCFGLHMGRPGGQNPAGDLLGHVTDTGAATSDKMSRLYKTSSNIEYHCDGADVVGLLCLKAAKSGGQSRIVSSVSVFNELVKTRPDLAARLFDPVRLDIRNEGSRSGTQYINVIPSRYADGVLRTFYHADYFRSVTRHDDVGPFSKDEQAFFDSYEAIAADPDLYLDMELQPGDIQLLSNHTNLHARTDYEDYDDPAEKRHLLRLWISLTD